MLNSADERFPAKLLLFGEYSLLLGSPALSMPFYRFHAALKFPDRETTEKLQPLQDESGVTRQLPGPSVYPSPTVDSNLQLRKLQSYFLENHHVFNLLLDHECFGDDLGSGLYLESDIPQQYGMGSSGALCAAVYDKYRLDLKEPLQPGDIPGPAPVSTHAHANLSSLRITFGLMESFFHGRSSGFDPLVSFLKTPLLLGIDGTVAPADLSGFDPPVTLLKTPLLPGSDSTIAPADLPVSDLPITLMKTPLLPGGNDMGTPADLYGLSSSRDMAVFLIDSGMQGRTGPLVNDFLARFGPGAKYSEKGERFRSLAGSCISDWLSGGINASWNAIGRLSLFQLTELSHLVPPHLQPAWREGLQAGLFSLKLCGSGGGGFLLGFTRSAAAAARYFSDTEIPFLPVYNT
jgi:mevalonate kinase